MTTSTSTAAATYLCRCLRVTSDEVRESILVQGSETVQEIRKHTGAGTGCMACHCNIRQMIRDYQAQRCS